jgi:long-subunit acyl-CoA synthetase (AMP-forming)
VKSKAKKQKKKPISGAEGRRRRRAKMMNGNGGLNTFIDLPEVRKIETLQDWHTQIARIYRRMVTGQIPDHIGTKLVYVITGGANIAKALDEQKAIEDLRKQLAQLQNGTHQQLGGQDYLPAIESQQEE